MKMKLFAMALAFFSVSFASVVSAAAPPVAAPVVTTRTQRGVKFQETVYSSGTKEVVQFQWDNLTPAELKEFDKTGKLVRYCEFSLNGTLLFETITRDDEKKIFVVYNPLTGKRSFERRVFRRNDVVETTYGDDGKPQTVLSSGGCLRGLVEVTHYLGDGMRVKRMLRHDGMSVNVFDKAGFVLFSQEWRLDKQSKQHVLESVEERTGARRRLIVLAKDGHTVERVDHFNLGRRGWDLERTETADKLTPKDYSRFADPFASFKANPNAK